MNGRYSRILIAGCGDIGRRTGVLWKNRGYDVAGIVRSDDSVNRLRDMGIRAIRTDMDEPGDFDLSLIEESLLYYLAPPPGVGATDPRLQKFLNNISGISLPQAIIYMSTSGVYGDTGGEWVTEESPVNPGTERSQRRVDAELTVRNWSMENDIPFALLRVPGIYGPGRVRLQRLQDRKPVLRREDAGWSNRVHADDLARICVEVGLHGEPNNVYNAGDGNPTTVTDFYFTIADLLEWERPPTISMDEARESMSAIRLSFLEESRRLDCTKLKEELGYEFLYPTVDEGLKATLSEMGYLNP